MSNEPRDPRRDVGEAAATRSTRRLPPERRTRWTPWHVLSAVLMVGASAVLLVLIYRLTDAGTEGATPSQVAAGPGSPAWASPTDVIGSGPAPTTPASAIQTREPATPITPVPTLSADEELLVNGLRDDAQVNCSPRREGLPEGARAGVECSPESPVDARVGVYLFDDVAGSVTAYFRRLAAYGVQPETGSCSEGVSGDAAWLEVDDAVEFNGAMYSIFREGCFTDEYGQANIRMTGLGGPVYVGIVSEQSDIVALRDWAWSGGDFEGGPGIYSFPCVDTGTEC